MGEGKMDKRRNGNTFRQLPGWMLAAIDVLTIGVCLLVFAYFDHVRPSAMQTDTTNQALTVQKAQQIAPEATEAPDPNDWRVKFADQFVTGGPVVTENSYRSENVSVTLTKYTVPEQELTYYVQDVYVADIECLRNVFAKDTFGKSVTEEVLEMDNRVNAIGAINGDYYAHGSEGVVIRNGVLYRDVWAPDQDVMVLFKDGTMKHFATEEEFDADAVMAQGAWQAWSFGPSLLKENGELLDSYERANHDPRTVFGMVEPGHYMLIVIDGRQGSYSEGTTYSETAKLCQAMGCVVAYNLDGGKTSQMTFQGRMANQPYEGGRKVSDLIYIADVG